jgi:formylglycine-generating enzyme required for sulfatase activity
VQDLNTGDYVTVVVTVKSRQWKYAVDSSGDSFSIGGVNFKMVNVDGGTFTMGATVDDEEDAKNYPNERPAHRVTLSDFQIGETEVTNELWDAVMGKDYGKYARLHEAAFSYNQERFPDDDPLSPQQPMSIEYQYLGSRFDYGVGMILNFIDSLNTLTGKHFRLPTEAEWEYAAKGGPQGHNYMFAGSNDLYDVAQVYRRGIDGYLKTITDSYGRPVVKDGKV